MVSDDDMQSNVNLYIPKDHSMKEDEESLLGDKTDRTCYQHKPEDRYNIVYIIFFVLGVGSLLPWNFFITAKHYWLYKLRNISNPEEPEGASDLGSYFESYLSIASTVPAVPCLLLNFLLINKVSSQVRILSSLVVMLFIFVVTTILVEVQTSAWTYTFFTFTLVCVAIISGASNIFTGSMFGVTGHFPMRNSQALISGQAMGGTISAVASVLDLAAASDIKTSALIYFLTADFFVVVCIIIYLLLPKLEYSRYYIKRAEDKLLLATAINSNSIEEVSHVCSASHPATRRDTRNRTVPPLLPILSKTSVLGFSVFYVFFISIIVFPSISTNIDSLHRYSGNMWSSKYFAPLTSFLLYNFADWCGRQMTAWVQVPGPQSKLLPILVLSRTVFLPLFMFCNYQPRNYIKAVLFKSDFYPVIFTCALGLSNGYLGTLSMIYGPKVVPKELAEATGVVMSVFLTLGLAFGSAFSILIVHFI